MDQQLKRELQIRSRVESIFNKRQEDFPNKKEFDDYLEEREDIIFNLCEGIDVGEMEEKIKKYRLQNAENILQNEARQAEELRRRADARSAAVDRAGVSGTAAAFEGGDAEPHQSMEYTTAVPAGMAMGPLPVPMRSLGEGGDIQQASTLDQMSHEQWRLMALASGWSPEMAKRRAWEEAFTSLLVF